MEAEPSGEHELIEHLYEVALDPGHYEAMLDHWERLLRPALDGQGALAPLSRLASHVARADKVLGQNMQLPPDEGAQAQVGRIAHSACFAVNNRGILLAANSATSLLFGLTPGAGLDDLPLEPEGIAEIAGCCRQLLTSNAPASRVLCLRFSGLDRMIVLQLRLCRPACEPAFVLCLTSEIMWPPGFAAALEESFGLSQTEIEVLRLLAEGYSPADIAERRRRSVETVRVQIKSLQARTGTRSQQELLRLTLAMIENLSDQASPEGPSNAPKPLSPRRLALPQGRQLDYLILGDPEGRPVLFIPLDLGFVRWTPLAEAEAERRGLKVIVPIRPGYGGSSPVPRRKDYLEQLIRDHLALLDHLRTRSLPILSHGDDSLFALQLIAAEPGRFSGLVACGGVMPLTRPEQLQRMGKWHRFILCGAKYTPHLLPFMVKAGAAMARRHGKEAFLASVYSASAADAATFALAEVRDTLVTSSDVMLSADHSAHEAFAQELIAKARANFERPVEILRSAVEAGRMQVIFFNGAQDPQVPLETLADFRSSHPWIDFRLFADAGQLIFYLKWRDVIEALDRMA